MYDPKVHGEATGIIPLMAVKQPNKQRKVRPVMDYRELNSHIKSNPGLDMAVCQEKLREWRMRGSHAAMLDLKKAYLQIHVAEGLRRFQVIKHNGKQYVMTRMGFGLNVAPKIMSKIISKVLSLDKDVAKGADHYIDDIWIDESVVSAEKVRLHLLKYGLVAKDPVPLTDTRVLGLRVQKDDGELHKWSRDGEQPAIRDKPTKRELFSLCGKLVGHYPIAGWLRVACSYIKRLTNDIQWDDIIPNYVQVMVNEVLGRVSQQDPVKGVWSVGSSSKGEVWCDASSIAVGCCLVINKCLVEDAAWLRKMDDGAHINVAELEAVIKGLSLALKWKITELQILTDSASVYSWVKSILEDSKRPKVSGLSEMIIKRRLGTIAQLIVEYHLKLSVKLVPSASNKADALTRVPQRWLKRVCLSLVTVDNVEKQVQMIHNKHHLGIDRTWYLAKKICGDNLEREVVEKVISTCNRCKKVDPSPIKWQHGELSVKKVWQRIAVDITYVNKKPYLSMIDCGPSRFAIWKSLANETAEQIVKHLRQVFLDRGPPDELLSDYGPCFISAKTEQFLKEWGVMHVFSCAYKHSGNGIVERNHRTIKRMAARTGGRIEDMVFWYNNTPNSAEVVPALAIYQYEPRLPGEPKRDGLPGSSRPNSSNPYKIGDSVYVKPANARCDTEWKTATVSNVVADTVVEVNGVNRHVADVRATSKMDDSMPRRDNQQMSTTEIEYNIASNDMIDGHMRDGNIADDDHPTNNEPVLDERESDNTIDAYDSSDDGPIVRDRRPPTWLSDFYTF
jgi:hypothetical protein